MVENKGSANGVLRPGLAGQIDGVMNLLGLELPGYRYVQAAIAAPSRRVEAGTKNVSGNYPSTKTGLSIAFEARTTEFPEILDAEWDPDTIAYFDQAPALVLRYSGANGRTKAYRQRPDFVRVYRGRIVLRECKTEQELLRRSVEDPNLFQRDAQGRWRCPPAEEAAAGLGLEHELVVDTNLSPTRARNLRVLLDYAEAGDTFESSEATDALCHLLREHKRLSIAEALDHLKGAANIDDVYRAVTLTAVFIAIDRDWIGDHERCYLYSDVATREAYKASSTAIATAATWVRASVQDLRPGQQLDWDGRIWSLANLGTNDATLIDGVTVHPLPREVFDQLIRDCRIRVVHAEAEAADNRIAQSYKLIQAATPLELSKALQVLKNIQPFLDGTAHVPPDRTQRRGLCNWRRGEAAFGNGFVGLLPHFSRCGNRTPRLEPAVLAIVRTQTELHYANPKKVRRLRVYERIAHACKEEGFLAPSYGWYCQYLMRRPAYDLTVAREGRRAAYNQEGRVEHTEKLLPHRADYAFQKAYVDHTQSDTQTSCSVTSTILGKPWLTLIVDDFSGDVIGRYLTYDPPSYRSVLMAIRDCVRRHGRLPESLVVDGGSEFSSVWFETTCAYFRVTIIRRPAAKPRFGSRGERVFGTLNSNFFHTLAGNTQLRKLVRQITPEVDPDNFTVWTFEALLNALDLYLDEYRNLVHREILMTPLQARIKSMQKMGNRPERRIAYDQDFLISTCPTTDRGQAKVQADGVKINYLYYSAPELRPLIGKKVPVRFDPYNMAIAYAMVQGGWVTLRSRFFAELKGRGERELIVAREQYRKRRGDVEKLRLSESSFVKFLLEMDKTEEMLIEHHRSIEMRRAADVIDELDEQDDEEGTSSSPGAVALPVPAREARERNPFDLSDEELNECEVS